MVAYVVLLAPPPKAAVAATLTTAPLLAFSAAAAARTQRKGPTRFTLSSLVQKASFLALEIRGRNGGARTGRGGVVHQPVEAAQGLDGGAHHAIRVLGAAMTLQPSPRRRSTSAFRRGLLAKSFMATAAPEDARASTVASPMPAAAPVTRAFLPRRSAEIFIVFQG